MSLLSTAYDLTGLVVAASAARVLVTPALLLSSNPTDEELFLLKNCSFGVAGILGLGSMWSSQNPLIGLALSIVAGSAVPFLLGLYFLCKRAPEFLRKWQESLDATSDQVLKGIESGEYVRQGQPILAAACEKLTKAVSQHLPQGVLNLVGSKANLETEGAVVETSASDYAEPIAATSESAVDPTANNSAEAQTDSEADETNSRVSIARPVQPPVKRQTANKS